MSDTDTNEDTMIQYDPDESGQGPYLKVGGKYGMGMEHPADITVSRFVPVRDEDGMPQFMLDEINNAVTAGQPRPRWARVGYAVVSEEFGKCFVDEDLRHGRQLNERLTTLGIQQQVEETTDSEGKPRRVATFSTGTIVGTKVGCIEVLDPKKSANGKWYTGRVKQVVGQ